MAMYCQRCDEDRKPIPQPTVYCAECPEGRRFLCSACAVCEHNVGSKSQYHSVEQVDTSLSPQQLIMPLLDAFLLPCLMYFFMSRINFHPAAYMEGADVCPITSHVRGGVARLDASVVYMRKSSFASACALEDGYWRFFMDAWVRGVLANSDRWLLLLSALPSALMFHFTFQKYIVDPILALVHALIITACYDLLRVLFSALPLEHLGLTSVPAWRSTRSSLSQVVDRIVSPMDRIPRTKPRTRPPKHDIDRIMYYVSRRFRIFRSFYGHASARITFFYKAAFLATLAFRILSITVGFGVLPQRLLARYSIGVDMRFEVGRHASGAWVDVAANRLLAGLAAAVIPSLLVFTFRASLALAVLMLPLLPVALRIKRQGREFEELAESAEQCTMQAAVRWPWVFHGPKEGAS